MSHRIEDDWLLCAIMRDYLDTFRIKSLVTVGNNLHLMRRIYEVGDKVLGLLEGIPKLGVVK